MNNSFNNYKDPAAITSYSLTSFLHDLEILCLRVSMDEFRSSPGGDAPGYSLTALSWVSQTVRNVPHPPDCSVSISVLVSVYVNLLGQQSVTFRLK